MSFVVGLRNVLMPFVVWLWALFVMTWLFDRGESKKGGPWLELDKIGGSMSWAYAVGWRRWRWLAWRAVVLLVVLELAVWWACNWSMQCAWHSRQPG